MTKVKKGRGLNRTKVKEGRGLNRRYVLMFVMESTSVDIVNVTDSPQKPYKKSIKNHEKFFFFKKTTWWVVSPRITFSENYFG